MEGPASTSPLTRSLQGGYVSTCRRVTDLLFPYFLIAPTLIVVMIFTLWPTAQAAIGSLYRPPLTVKQQPQFVGLQNYVDLLDPGHSIRPDMSSTFPRILFNTLVFTAATTLISIPLSFGI